MMRVDDCRLIVDPPASGAWNMATDEVLLADAIENGIATLRLYQWSEPTLSLGYFQRYADREKHAASRNAAIVRRQSGGGAILHDRELTYSLALPPKHSLTRDAEKLYTAVHRAVAAVLAPHVATTTAGWKLRLRCDDCWLPTNDDRFLCFQRQAKGDLLLVRNAGIQSAKADWPGWKILGSAQRRRQGAILQHGSLLFAKSPAAPELDGLNDLVGTTLNAVDIAGQIARELCVALGFRFRGSGLADERQRLAKELESRKYAAAAWTKRR
jgi:lipoyl(octanoyl) transferase